LREAAGFFTHIATPDALKRYRKLKDDLSGIAQTAIVAEAGTPVPEALREETHFFDFQELAAGSRIIGSGIVPGNCHLAMLAFFRAEPNFDHYWHIEYDAVFTGSWRTLIEAWSGDDSDLVAPQVRPESDDPDWYWWPSVRVPAAVAQKGLMRAFLPVYRISHRALECLEAALREGHAGHFEALIPTALNAASLKISDLGQGRFYTSVASSSGGEAGTLRHKPRHAGPLTVENHIYHPVKPRNASPPKRRRSKGDASLTATIVVPVYETEAYLAECLGSLQDQTRADFDVVVVDDGSSGDSEPIVKFFQEDGLDIQFVRHPESRGTLAARLTGVGHARGDYIGFLDSDDAALPNFVERLLGTAEETKADIVGSATTGSHLRTHFTLSGEDEILRAYADKTIPNWNVWTKFYRKALLSNLNTSPIAGRRIVTCEDVVLNVFCALENPTYVHVPEVLVAYNRERPDSNWNPARRSERQNTLEEAIHAYEIIRAAAPGHEDAINKIIKSSTKYIQRKLLLRADSEFVAWALAHIRESPMAGLMVPAMMEGGIERIAQLEQRLAHRRDAIKRLEKTLASKQEQLSRTRERLRKVKKRQSEARARRRLGPTLGDLWRRARFRLWGRS